jgi:phage terminase small subunit
MPGGPRKPKSEHLIDGTWNRAAANGPSAAAKTANHCPPMPADLDDVAKGVWEHVCKTRANWLALSDGLALRHLCELWSLRSATMAILRDNPTDRGARVSFQQYGAEFAKLCGKFGLTPQDRARQGEVVDDDDELARYFLR